MKSSILNDDPVALVCNQNAKLLDMPLCRVLRSTSGQIYDIIAGKFIVIGDGEEGFASLTDELLEKYENVFAHPELIFGTNDEGEAVVIELPI